MQPVITSRQTEEQRESSEITSHLPDHQRKRGSTRRRIRRRPGPGGQHRATVDTREGGSVGGAGRTTHRTASSPTRSACPCCGTGRPAPRRAAGRCSRTWPGSEGRRAGGLTTEFDARRTRLLYPPAGGSTHRGPPGSGRGRPCVRLPPGGNRGRDASRPA